MAQLFVDMVLYAILLGGLVGLFYIFIRTIMDA